MFLVVLCASRSARDNMTEKGRQLFTHKAREEQRRYVGGTMGGRTTHFRDDFRW